MIGKTVLVGEKSVWLNAQLLVTVGGCIQAPWHQLSTWSQTFHRFPEMAANATSPNLVTSWLLKA